MSLFVDVVLLAAALATGWLLLLNLLAPLLVWRLQTAPDHYRLPPANLPACPGADTPECRQWHDAVGAAGFDFVGASTLQFSHAQSVFRIYRHADSMMAVILTATNGKRQMHTLEFVQLFTDGRTLNVLNSEQPPVYPVLPHKQVYRMPWLRDGKRLLEAARQLRERETSARRAPEPGQEMSEIEDYLNREQAELIAAGFFQKALRADGRRGLTLKGAYLMCWRLLWPLRGVNDWRERQRAKAAGLPMSAH